MNRYTSFVLVAAIALVFSVSALAQKHGGHEGSAQTVVVQFGQAQPQSAPAPVTHFLDPDEVTIEKGGTVTFVVNGGGHAIAIHRVSKKTTREDIAEDLCQGGTDDADRLGRSLVCNGTIATGIGTPAIIGTQNLNYEITDGDNHLVIRTGFNNPAAGDADNNPRVDDTAHSQRLLSTSGRIGNSNTPNPAGAFLAGTNAAGAAGNRIQVTFLKSGKYLVICQNRGHSLNDHMFGFVNVGDDDEDEQ